MQSLDSAPVSLIQVHSLNYSMDPVLHWSLETVEVLSPDTKNVIKGSLDFVSDKEILLSFLVFFKKLKFVLTKRDLFPRP